MLALVAATLVLVLVAGALAVDISALDRQGQSLQNTADAAALAAVAAYTESGDQVAALGIIEDLIAQNGVEIGTDVMLEVDFPTDQSVSVRLINSEPDAFLGSVIGFNGQLERDATAQLEQCDEGCTRVLEIPPPLGAILAQGSGDGYRPIPVGNRLYSVNHHSTTMACVDRITQDYCWSSVDKPLFWSNHITSNQVHAHLHEDKIYFLGHSQTNPWWYGFQPSSGRLRVSCFDTTLDQPCSTSADIWNEGQAIMAGVGDRLFVFTNARKVHCYELPSMSTCSGYWGGRYTSLDDESDWTWPVYRVRSWNSDRKIHNGKIYSVFSAVWSNNTVRDVRMSCWDTTTNNPCSGFGNVRLHSSQNSGWFDWAGARLFFHRNSSGDPTAICSTGWNSVECYDLNNGSYRGSESSTMAATVGNFSYVPNGTYVGRHTYHEQTNRLFMAGRFSNSVTYCHDFNTGSYCGQAYNSTPWGGAWTYVYHPEPNCLIGLGHTAIFFSLKPDMSGPCDGSSSSVDLTPCLCGGEIKWPPIAPANTEGVGSFEIRVVDPDGNVLIPADGEGFVDLLAENVSLDDIATTYEYLTVEVAVEDSGEGIDPWDGNPPSLLVGIADQDPRLVE